MAIPGIINGARTRYPIDQLAPEPTGTGTNLAARGTGLHVLTAPPAPGAVTPMPKAPSAPPGGPSATGTQPGVINGVRRPSFGPATPPAPGTPMPKYPGAPATPPAPSLPGAMPPSGSAQGTAAGPPGDTPVEGRLMTAVPMGGAAPMPKAPGSVTPVPKAPGSGTPMPKAPGSDQFGQQGNPTLRMGPGTPTPSGNPALRTPPGTSAPALGAGGPSGNPALRQPPGTSVPQPAAGGPPAPAGGSHASGPTVGQSMGLSPSDPRYNLHEGDEYGGGIVTRNPNGTFTIAANNMTGPLAGTSYAQYVRGNGPIGNVNGENQIFGITYHGEGLNQDNGTPNPNSGFNVYVRQVAAAMNHSMPNDPRTQQINQYLAQLGAGSPPDGFGGTTASGQPGDGSGSASGGGAGAGGPGSIAGGAGGSGAGGAGANGQAWNPTSGIIDQVRGINPQDVTATGYDAQTGGPAAQATATGYDATGINPTFSPESVGYDANGYKPATADAAQTTENVSQATDRIIGQDSPIMQRAQAQAQQAANARGLSNSTMAVEAGQSAVLDKASTLAAGDVQAGQFNVDQLNQMRKFNADATNTAGAFLADAKNKSAEFLAAAKNQNGQFNAQQAQDASKFSADAKNQAEQMLAAAKNTASLSNSVEANRQSQFAISQLNAAAQFAAQAQNAASSQNATAHNEAMQRFTDAMNAALAAQNDAENLARRDTAQIGASLQQTAMQGQTSRDVANISGNTSRDVARISGDTSRDVARMSGDTSRDVATINSNTSLRISQAEIAQRNVELDSLNQRFGVQMDQQERQFTRSLSAQQFRDYMTGLQTGMSLDMDPEARQNWLHNYNSVWAASGKLPFDIDMSAFPPAAAAPPPPPK